MAYRTGFSLMRARDDGFASWALSVARLDSGAIHGAASGPSEALGPVVETDFPFVSCVPSWNVDAPDGSRLEAFVRARSAGTWSGWYSFGTWAPTNDGGFERHSLAGQDDERGSVATDTLNLASPADAFQAKVRFIASGSGGAPVLRAFSLAYSDPKPKAESLVTSRPRAGGAMVLDVPRASQMVYPNGGNVWCSPTSVSMVLRYWQGLDSGDQGEPEPAVRAAVAGVYDAVYKGHGNWSFNAAYAGSRPGREAYVARFTGLDRLEPWIRSGVPVVLSVSWNNDEGRLLSAAPVSRSSGHLTTLVGFDERGDPVMNEPASPSNETVRRVYDRGELEARWLSASGGVAYIIVAPERVDAAPLFAQSVGGQA